MTKAAATFCCILSVLFLTASAEAKPALNFALPTNAISASFLWLEKNQDPTLAEIRAIHPHISSETQSLFLEHWNYYIPNIAYPGEIRAKNDKNQEDVQGSLFEMIGMPYLIPGDIYEIIPSDLRGYGYDGVDRKRYSYRFYEKSNITPPEYITKITPATWALARRIISTPAFADGICSDSTVDLFDWYLSWSKFAGEVRGIRAGTEWFTYLNQMDSYLNRLATTTWSDNAYDESMSRNLMGFIFRRYLDGGPEFAQAAGRCVSKLKERVIRSKLITSDPSYTAVFAKELQFKTYKMTSNPRLSIEVSSIEFSLSSFAQIVRFQNQEQLPSELRYPRNHERNPVNPILNLTQWMSALDPKFNYRIITDEESKAFGFYDDCYASQNYILEGFKDLYTNCRIDYLQSLRLVRETK